MVCVFAYDHFAVLPQPLYISTAAHLPHCIALQLPYTAGIYTEPLPNLRQRLILKVPGADHSRSVFVKRADTVLQIDVQLLRVKSLLCILKLSAGRWIRDKFTAWCLAPVLAADRFVKTGTLPERVALLMLSAPSD